MRGLESVGGLVPAFRMAMDRRRICYTADSNQARVVSGHDKDLLSHRSWRLLGVKTGVGAGKSAGSWCGA